MPTGSSWASRFRQGCGHASPTSSTSWASRSPRRCSPCLKPAHGGEPMILPTAVAVGLGACALAMLIVVALILAPRPVRLSLERRRTEALPQASALAGAAHTATTLSERFLRRRGGHVPLQAALERAGV